LTLADDMAKKKLSPKYQVWIDARRRFHLSHMHVQMAREIGLNPKKLGEMANNDQEPWKEPLPDYIETLYRKHSKKERPDHICSIEQMVSDKKRRKAECKAQKQLVIHSKDVEPVGMQPSVQEARQNHKE